MLSSFTRSNKAISTGSSMDGLLGILDRACPAFGRRTDLGFCGTFGQLGRALGALLFVKAEIVKYS